MLDIGKNQHLCFLGQSRSGKSTLINAFLRKYGSRFDRIYVFSMTGWSGFRNERTVVTEEFNEGAIEEFYDMISAYVKAHKGKKKPRIIILFDDFLSAIRKPKAEIWTKIATQGRHYAFWIFSVQYFTSGLPVPLRKQMHCIIAMVNGLSDSDVACLVGYVGLQSRYRGKKWLLDDDLRIASHVPYSFIITTTGFDVSGKGLYFCSPIKDHKFSLKELPLEFLRREIGRV